MDCDVKGQDEAEWQSGRATEQGRLVEVLTGTVPSGQMKGKPQYSEHFLKGNVPVVSSGKNEKGRSWGRYLRNL